MTCHSLVAHSFPGIFISTRQRNFRTARTNGHRQDDGNKGKLCMHMSALASAVSCRTCAVLTSDTTCTPWNSLSFSTRGVIQRHDDSVVILARALVEAGEVHHNAATIQVSIGWEARGPNMDTAPSMFVESTRFFDFQGSLATQTSTLALPATALKTYLSASVAR